MHLSDIITFFLHFVIEDPQLIKAVKRLGFDPSRSEFCTIDTSKIMSYMTWTHIKYQQSHMACPTLFKNCRNFADTFTRSSNTLGTRFYRTADLSFSFSTCSLLSGICITIKYFPTIWFFNNVCTLALNFSCSCDTIKFLSNSYTLAKFSVEFVIDTTRFMMFIIIMIISLLQLCKVFM